MKHLVCLMLVWVVLSTAVLPAETRAEGRPNVILILADDLGIGDVSAFNGQAAFRTRNLDRLAARGMMFTDAHSNAAICTPTRYGILTGRYAWRSELKSGVFDGYAPPLIGKDRLTIARLFQQNGYHTGIVGKWHLGWDWAYRGKPANADGTFAKDQIDFSRPIRNGPQDVGFTYSFVLPKSLSAPPYVYVENSLPTSIPNETSVNYDSKALWGKGPKGADFNHVDVLPRITEKSIEYLQERAKSDQPFFLFCSLTAPHAPIIPTTEFIGKSNTNYYGDFVLMVDHMIGRIMDAIEADPRLKNTLIIVTSDNGQTPRADFDDNELKQAGHNGSYIYRGKKFDIFEGGHRVPFIASWPGKIAEKTVSEETVCTVDFMATAAEMLGVKLPETAGEDSYSLLPVLLQQPYPKPLREATVLHSSDGRFAIRKGDWKLILWAGSGGWAFPKTASDMAGLPRFQLYNMRDDPSEKSNVISAHPELAQGLQVLLEKYVDDGRSTPGARQSNEGPKRWPQLEWMAP